MLLYNFFLVKRPVENQRKKKYLGSTLGTHTGKTKEENTARKQTEKNAFVK